MNKSKSFEDDHYRKLQEIAQKMQFVSIKISKKYEIQSFIFYFK